MNSAIKIRHASISDLDSIRMIYNQGIEERIANLESNPKTSEYIMRLYNRLQTPYAILIAENKAAVAGWAALGPFSHR